MIERPMTVIERLLHSVYQVHQGDGLPVFAVRCSGPWEAERFRRALDAVQARHPLLRSRIVESKRYWPKFQLVNDAPPIPLEIGDDASAGDWKHVALEQARRTFDVGCAPLCRMAVLPSAEADGFDLIAAFHHSIIDAISVLALLREIFTHMAGEPIAESPCHDELVFRPMKATTIWQRLRLISRLLWVQGRQLVQPSMLMTPDRNQPQGCVRIVWPKELTTNLVRRCRKEKTTVFGALAALAMRTLAEREDWEQVSLQLQVPFDIRQEYATPVDRQTLGCFVGIMDFWHDHPLGRDFWHLARRCRRDVEFEKNWRMPNCWDSLMSVIPFSPAFFKPFRKMSIGVNNLGRCEEIGIGPWRLEEFSWFGRAQSLGASLYLNTATINGRLNLTLQGAEASQETLQEIGDKLTSEMEFILQSRSFTSVSWAA
ncbi:MAG: condensation domain-containing protein [Planctomycetaceae bacterium]